MDLFNAKDYATDKALALVLKDCIQTFKALGYADKESQVQSLKAELVTAQRGMNPYTLQKQNMGRNEMFTSVMFKILQALEVQLRTYYLVGDEKLQQARELISQIIVAALQGGFLTNLDIKNIKTQKQTEVAWKKLGEDANISLGQKRVLLIVSPYDAIILFDELITTLKK
ncbi:MAG: hypothetical protein ACOYLO_05710 [Ferruginibacter sp.]